MNDWRDMGSAPKDGTLIVLGFRDPEGNECWIPTFWYDPAAFGHHRGRYKGWSGFVQDAAQIKCIGSGYGVTTPLAWHAFNDEAKTRFEAEYGKKKFWKLYKRWRSPARRKSVGLGGTRVNGRFATIDG